MTKPNSQDLSLTNKPEFHWAFKYIGMPWVNGGQGPKEFDCWGFFRHVQKERYNNIVPVINIDADDYKDVAYAFTKNEERNNWLKIDVPKDGDAVLLAHAKYPSHVGVWIEADGAGGLLHCVRGEGVVFSTITALKNSGWGRIEYFSHVSNT